jgi:hypothetical protein
MRLHGNVGGLLFSLHLRSPQRRTGRLDLRFPFLLGRLGMCGRNHGRVGEHVADSGRAVPLDVYACAGRLEIALELFDGLVRTIHTGLGSDC